MNTRITLICMLLACMTSLGADVATTPEQAAEYSRSARELLAQGDFDGALDQLGAAAKADPKHTEHRRELAVLRAVIRARESIVSEVDAARWEQLARALRAYYHEHGIFGEALELDGQLHARLGTAESAAMLAESRLALKRNAAALETLGEFDASALTPRGRSLMALATARLGRADDAARLVRECTDPGCADAAVMFDLACAHSLLGDQTAAANHLIAAFEHTPPSRLDALKNLARRRADLKPLSQTDLFVPALATKSRVKESGCSGGSSCGKCPSRGTCGGNQK